MYVYIVTALAAARADAKTKIGRTELRTICASKRLCQVTPGSFSIERRKV